MMDLLRAADAVKVRFPNAAPRAGLILGSGWSTALAGFRELKSIQSSEIPGMGSPTVAGHPGRIILAECHGMQTLIFQGRRHWYEGTGWLPVILPVFLMKVMGVRTVILTNAAGGIRADLEPGSVSVIADHLNLMGANPLAGPHHPQLGPRFPDLSAVYDPELRRHIREAAEKAGIPVAEGVYAAMAGPSYETPAEVRMLARLGADLVGMSTVPEAIVAASCGMTVGALSCVTNRAAGLSEKPLSHAEVLKILEGSGERLGRLLMAVWNRLPGAEG